MPLLSVSEAADGLGVSERRVRHRISDGSLRAQRIGGRWAIDDRALVSLRDRPSGRPLSYRSAWALIVAVDASVSDHVWSELSGNERSRARGRFASLRAESGGDVDDQLAARVGHQLWHLLRNRARRFLYVAASADLEDLRADIRVALAGLSHPVSGLASGDLCEAYVPQSDLSGVVSDYLLDEVVDPSVRANVVVHVLPGGLSLPVAAAANARLALAADLAEHRGPREQARALDLARDVFAGEAGGASERRAEREA